MRQLALFQDLGRIINVASVPQRSPFRYPGGKTWLVPYIRRWLRSMPERPREFIEPFCGGGIVALTVAFEELADHVTMVELDARVASVWQTILGGGADWLADRIKSFVPTEGSVREELSKDADGTREMAFQTLLRNRVTRGGIIAPGASLMRRGENGKGIYSRWYPDTLARRVRSIAAIKDRITFIHGDGMDVLKTNRCREDAVYFLDPPYTAGCTGKRAGRRLYVHNELDHEALFALADQLAGDFLMTYDTNVEVREMAARHRFQLLEVPMKSTHHARMTELLIGRDLSWAREHW